MKLKRLVSAILAVGMALTMLPTAAFAANAPTYVNHLSFIGDQPDTKGKNAVNGMIIVDHAYNWSWSGSDALLLILMKSMLKCQILSHVRFATKLE